MAEEEVYAEECGKDARRGVFELVEVALDHSIWTTGAQLSYVVVIQASNANISSDKKEARKAI